MDGVGVLLGVMLGVGVIDGVGVILGVMLGVTDGVGLGLGQVSGPEMICHGVNGSGFSYNQY